MAMDYRLVDRDQEFLLPPDMREWLPEDHLVWFLIAAVERMDTTAFHAKSKLGGVGRRGYDPQMLLTLFIYAMAQGESSSRRMERLCHTDVAFRVICAQDVPDHTVLARFRQKHEHALTSMLTESLVLAAELGMVSLGVVALDGTKIAASASKDANRSEATLHRLAQEYVGAVADTDAEEDALFGADASGDELPEAVRDRSDRPGRIDQALEQIAAKRSHAEAAQETTQAKAREYENAVTEGTATRGRPPRGADPVAMAKARWERTRAEAAARYEKDQQDRQAGVRKPGRAVLAPDEHSTVRRAWAAYQDALTQADHQRGPAEDDPAAETERPQQTDKHCGGTGEDAEITHKTEKTDAAAAQQFRANLTDPDSRLLKTRKGWIQGMNCQTSTSDDVFILSACATQDANDLGQFIPVKDQIEETMAVVAARTGRRDLSRIGTMIADAGYDSEANLTAEGPERLIADSKRHRIESRAAQEPAEGEPPEDATAGEAMNHRLRTPEGLDGM